MGSEMCIRDRLYVLNLLQAIVFEPQGLEPCVLLQVVDVGEALVVQIEDVIEARSHVQAIFTAMVLN